MEKSVRKKKKSFFERIEKDIQEAIKEEVAELPVTKPVRKFYQRRPIQVMSLFVIAALILGVFAYLQFQKLRDAQVSGSQQIKDLISEVGDKIIFPSGETPTIATVTDVTKLIKQPFFKSARNGDKVMIFASTKEVILYRPSVHKIVSVAPVSESKTSQDSQQNSTPSSNLIVTPIPQKLKVIVLNSTKTAGLAKKVSVLFVHYLKAPPKHHSVH